MYRESKHRVVHLLATDIYLELYLLPDFYRGILGAVQIQNKDRVDTRLYSTSLLTPIAVEMLLEAKFANQP